MIDRDDLLDAIGMVNGEAVYDAWALDGPETPKRRGRSLLRRGALALLAAENGAVRLDLPLSDTRSAFAS